MNARLAQMAPMSVGARQPSGSTTSGGALFISFMESACRLAACCVARKQ